MAYYRAVGDIPPKRHTQHRDRVGSLLFEELVGAEGFSSDSSLLYHRTMPTAIVASREWDLGSTTTQPNHPLRARHFRLHGLFNGDSTQTDAVRGRRVILGNADVRLSYVVAGQPSPLYRNALGDECVYLESGQATVETVFGALTVGSGDYVLIPRSTAHRWLPQGKEELRAYCIEANSHITPVRRYLSRFGQLLEHAPYCERDLRGPEEPLLAEGTGIDVLIKHRDSRSGGMTGSVVTYENHPFDVVGWDGCLYPYVFNVADYEPITGRVHQPPPSHQVFEGNNFVVCNFVPRKLDYHPKAIPSPYYHSNVDSDEVMFYCGGDYTARVGSGIATGSVSLHPGGIAHGAHPGAYEGSIGAEFTDELAVMVDTFRPLELGEGGSACEDPDYAWSWSQNGVKHDAPR